MFFCLFSVAFLAAQANKSSVEQEKIVRKRIAIFKKQIHDWGGLDFYGRENAKLPPPGPRENRIVFIGDSITALWDFAEYFPGKPYINRGIAAQTTSQILLRFHQDALNLKPKIVIVLAGTNDIAGNTGPMTLDQIENNYASMTELARSSGVKIVFASVLPIHNYTKASHQYFAKRQPDSIIALNHWLESYCDVNGIVFIDLYSALVDDKGMFKLSLSEDGLHPDAAGYKVLSPLVEAAIQKALMPVEVQRFPVENR